MIAPREVIRPSVLVLLAASAFGLCLFAGFVFDDFAIFTARPLTRPLTWLTFRLNQLAGGQHPAGFHALNLAMHLTCIWLVRETLQKVSTTHEADVAAIVFGLHPLQAEAVSYVWARSSVLMTLFCLLAFRDWVNERHWRCTLWFAIALLAKEECVAFPVFLLLFEYSRRRACRNPVPIAAMLALATASGSWVLWAANRVAGSQAGAQSTYSPLTYFASEGLAILRYLQLLVVPVGFTADPDLPAGQWIAWLPVLLLSAFAARHFRGSGWGFWFLGGLALLLPTSSIFPVNDLAADRRMYLPMVSFAALAGIVLGRLDRRWIWCLALSLAALSFWRSWIWQSNVRLWSEAEARAPRKLRPKIQLARAVPPERGLSLLSDAKKIAPEDPLVASELGRMYLALGRPAEALPEFGKALALMPGDARALSNRGVTLLLLGQTDAARADFQRALRADPCVFEARYNLLRIRSDAPPAAECVWTEAQSRALSELK